MKSFLKYLYGTRIKNEIFKILTRFIAQISVIPALKKKPWYVHAKNSIWIIHGGTRKITTYTAPKYSENILEIFLGSIVRLTKYFETYHSYC